VILVDTSVWIDSLRHGFDDHLTYLLDGESVLMHDFVIGELAMGSLKDRRARLSMLANLHRIPTASDYEVLTLVESEKLYGLGLTYIDVHLLTATRASADFEPVRLWTADKKLAWQAQHLGVAYQP
jgi:predicted nucleic acid-binding protein